MVRTGERVIHQTTGQIGEVIGYGHKIFNSAYETTLKVLVASSNSGKQLQEDLYSAWTKCQDT